MRGLRVLAVDDDPDARELLTITLIRFGAEVRAADSAQQALEIFGQWRPDVLISDIEMPDIDGHTLIGKLRNLEPDEDGMLPAIALTAHARAEDRDRALRAGFHIHISKPVAPTELNLILLGLKNQIQIRRWRQQTHRLGSSQSLIAATVAARRGVAASVSRWLRSRSSVQ